MRLGALPKTLCLAACACAAAPHGPTAAQEPVSTTIAAVYDRPGAFSGRLVRVRGWAAPGLQICNFFGRPCPPAPRVLVCQRPQAELQVDSLAVTILELRTADGAPLGPAPELINDAFYEVVGEVHAGRIPVLRVHSVRPAKVSSHDCQAPAKPNESDELDESDESG